jgi:hypothetical protein
VAPSEHADREVEDVLDRCRRFDDRQSSGVNMSPKNRSDFDAEQIGSDDHLAAQVVAESPAIGTVVRDRRCEH